MDSEGHLGLSKVRSEHPGAGCVRVRSWGCWAGSAPPVPASALGHGFLKPDRFLASQVAYLAAHQRCPCGS